jgi:hypothetical protein
VLLIINDSEKKATITLTQEQFMIVYQTAWNSGCIIGRDYAPDQGYYVRNDLNTDRHYWQKEWDKESIYMESLFQGMLNDQKK